MSWTRPLTASPQDFTSRLDVYVRHRISAALRAQVVAILALLFEALVLATKEIRRGRLRAYLERLIGSESPVQPALDKLKTLTLGEERQVLADTFGNISELSTKAGQIEDAVTLVNQGVQSLRAEHRNFPALPSSNKLRDILNPSPFPEDIYNAFKKSTIPRTGDWILEDEGLNAWLRGEVPYLWIFGNAGGGAKQRQRSGAEADCIIFRHRKVISHGQNHLVGVGKHG